MTTMDCEIPSGQCKEHAAEVLDSYCVDCRHVICRMCLVSETHCSHHCIDSATMTERFRHEVTDNLNALQSNLENEKKLLEAYEREILEDVSRAEKAITARVDRLKELIDVQSQLLRKELASLKLTKLDEAKIKKEELDERQQSASKYLSRWKEAESKGSVDEVWRIFHVLQETTSALQLEITVRCDDLEHNKLHVCFEEPNLEAIIGQVNLVGDIKEKLDPSVAHVTSQVIVTADGFNAVTGWTVLAGQLFFSREESSTVEFYDVITFRFEGQWRLRELANPAYLTSCEKNRCLYVINIQDDSESVDVFAIEADGRPITSWATDEECVCCLAVTADGNVVLPVYAKSKLNEYSPAGQLVREILLGSDPGHAIGRPVHVVPLTSGQFLVSFGDLDDDDSEEDEYFCSDDSCCDDDDDDDDDDDESEEQSSSDSSEVEDDINSLSDECINENYRDFRRSFDYGRLSQKSDSGTGDNAGECASEHKICLIDPNGQILRSFGHRRGSGEGRLNLPSSLAVQSNGCIVVADNRNDRVVLLSPDLEFKTELISKAQGLNGPRGILLHGSTGRMFVMSKGWSGNRRKRGRIQFARVK